MRRLIDWWATIVLAAGLLWALSMLPAGKVTGRAEVIDGDSLRLGNEEIRLFAIDAPEARQTCTGRSGKRWPCGRAATRALRALVRGDDVVCSGDERDRYQRRVAVCKVAGKDIGAEMVERGHAIALRGISTAYVPEEADARSARRGIWSGRFTEPRIWRERNRTR